MKLRIEIEMDSEAFDRRRRSEVHRILDELIDKNQGFTLHGVCNVKLRDINGNTVGKAEVIE